MNISKNGDFTTSLGNLCKCLINLTVKKYFLVFRGNLLHFSFCSLSLVLSMATTVKSPDLYSLHLSFRYLYILRRFLWAFPSLGWTVPDLSIFPHMREVSVPYSALWPFTGLPPVALHLPCAGELRTGLNSPSVASPVLRRKEGSLLWSADNTLPIGAQNTISLLCHKKDTFLAHG